MTHHIIDTIRTYDDDDDALHCMSTLAKIYCVPHYFRVIFDQ